MVFKDREGGDGGTAEVRGEGCARGVRGWGDVVGLGN